MDGQYRRIFETHAGLRTKGRRGMGPLADEDGSDMIWIRADANGQIGTGHVMRCLCVAGELKRLGAQVCFLVSDERSAPLLEAKGQEFRILQSDYRYPEGELETLEALFRQEGGAFFLADGYFVTGEYFRRIRRHMPAGYLDDMLRRDLPLDLLVNYNIFASGELYGEVPGRPRMLLGPAYAPLRREFRGRGYQVRQQAKRVLVTTGGADQYNLAGRFVEEALAEEKTAELQYDIVSGAYNAHLEELKRLEAGHGNVFVRSNVKDMAALMLDSDVAVTAGGSTMYELSAIGVPMICFSFVDNQREIVEGFKRKDVVCFGGNYLLQGDGMLRAAAGKLAELAACPKLREGYSLRQRQVTDGGGARRIADAVMELRRCSGNVSDTAREPEEGDLAGPREI